LTLPSGTLACVDFIAAQLHQSRSGTVRAALEHLLDAYIIRPAAKPESDPHAS
jgi:hypothetical protein